MQVKLVLQVKLVKRPQVVTQVKRAWTDAIKAIQAKLGKRMGMVN
jgi:hypothetical protein